jgi:hypothetical protein
MMDAPVRLLPAPDSPTTPRISPGAIEGDVVQRAQRAAAAGEFDDEVLDVEEAHRSLGFRASRSQSPSRFTDSAIRISIRPGKMVIHHSPENR